MGEAFFVNTGLKEFCRNIEKYPVKYVVSCEKNSERREMIGFA